jgi:hypothetical protein
VTVPWPMRLNTNRTAQMKMSVKLSNSPGARQDRRGLGLNGEWPPRISSSFLEGHAPPASFVDSGFRQTPLRYRRIMA